MNSRARQTREMGDRARAAGTGWKAAIAPAGARRSFAFSWFVPFFAVLLAALPARAAGNGETVLHAGVQEVRIAFSATDASGEPVASLKSSEVAVVDDGWVIRQFRSFGSTAETPLDLVLLLDASASVKSQLSRETADAKRFLQAADYTQNDRVSILIFGGGDSRLLCLRNCLGQSAPHQLKHLHAGGLTPLYDAIVEAAEILRHNRDPRMRPAMVLFSDGIDSSSMYSLREALGEAESLAAPIYTVDACRKKCESGDGDAVLAYLARNTGGLHFSSTRDIQDILRRVLGDLHGGYVLTYEPSEHLPGIHSIRLVPTSDAQLRFRSRRAYDDISDEY